ncbi:MAG: CopD family protein [Burkholderiaceae bacterium]
MHGLWVFLHLSGVVIWVGGMFFALHCLHPAAADLQPQQRVPLMVGALGRFFNMVLVALVLIWVSGLAMLMPVGFKGAPPGWHLMITLGTIMSVVFLIIRFAMYPRAVSGVARADLPSVARVLGRIRPLVITNMVLGFLAIAAVSMLR